MKRYCGFFITVLLVLPGYAQDSFAIRGMIPGMKGRTIVLQGYTTFGDTLLADSRITDTGSFEVQYPATYSGAGVLRIEDGPSVIVLLNRENFIISWSDTGSMDSLNFKHSKENEAFSRAMKLYRDTEMKLAGLKYLKPLYVDETGKKKWLAKEIALQEQQYNLFLKELPESMYARDYLRIRKLIEDMPVTAQRYNERMPEHEKDFKKINFNDVRLRRSGLYVPLLEGYFTLMESYGLEKMYLHINSSIDALLKSIAKNEQLWQETGEFLFHFFERRSLFPAAEYLSEVMLGEEVCLLDKKRENLFEQYRRMAVGKTVPEIVFDAPVKGVNCLSEVPSKYQLVVFGASWCSECQREIHHIRSFYEEYKKEVAVIWISLDTQKEGFEAFLKNEPFYSYCDYGGWDSPVAKAYYVNALPTMYLVDENNTIVHKPRTISQLKAWMKSHSGQEK